MFRSYCRKDLTMRGIYLEQGKVTLRDDLPAGDVCDDEVRIQHYHDWMDHYMGRR